MEGIMIEAVRNLVFLKKQKIITGYTIRDEEEDGGEIEFKFRINGCEEKDRCEAEESGNIISMIEEAENQYWENIADEEKYKQQLESDYWAVQGVKI